MLGPIATRRFSRPSLTPAAAHLADTQLAYTHNQRDGRQRGIPGRPASIAVSAGEQHSATATGPAVPHACMRDTDEESCG